jgi:hypothetical protein
MRDLNEIFRTDSEMRQALDVFTPALESLVAAKADVQRQVDEIDERWAGGPITAREMSAHRNEQERRTGLLRLLRQFDVGATRDEPMDDRLWAVMSDANVIHLCARIGKRPCIENFRAIVAQLTAALAQSAAV